MLLESTPEKLLQSKENEILDNHTNIERCFFYIDKLDDVKKITFLYICLFLRDLCAKNQQNRQNLSEDVLGNTKYCFIEKLLFFKCFFLNYTLAHLFGQVFFKSFEKNRGPFKIFVYCILQSRTFDDFARSRLYT